MKPYGIFVKLLMLVMKTIFYLDAFIWTIPKRKISSMEDILRLFYFDFLRLRTEELEVVKLTDRELITRARNFCPILWISLKLGLDTKIVCRYVSEPVCKFALSKLNKSIVFERNYSHIRPYQDSCEERIYIDRT